MRTIALAAIIGAAFTFATPVAAQQFSDSAGRITFNTPSGWRAERQGPTAQTVVLLFNASNDCYVFGTPNSVTANASPDAVVRTTTTPIEASAWTNTANSVRDFFSGNSAQLVSQTVDTSRFWPVQRAQFNGAGGKTVYAAMTSRPGFDLMAFCAPASGAGAASSYDTLFNSLAHPNDAAWQQAAGDQAAARQAAQEAAAAQQSAAAQQQAQPQVQEADGVNDGVARSSRDPRARRSRGN
jgi:hypothetical protein